MLCYVRTLLTMLELFGLSFLVDCLFVCHKVFWRTVLRLNTVRRTLLTIFTSILVFVNVFIWPHNLLSFHLSIICFLLVVFFCAFSKYRLFLPILIFVWITLRKANTISIPSLLLYMLSMQKDGGLFVVPYIVEGIMSLQRGGSTICWNHFRYI